jgi:pyridoxal/pyridoxine/pyridoxamine kinase
MPNFRCGQGAALQNETEAETVTGLPVRSIDEATECAERLVASGIRGVILDAGRREGLSSTVMVPASTFLPLPSRASIPPAPTMPLSGASQFS